MLNKIKFSGTIAKFHKQEDGYLVVTGYASSPDVDSQGEQITAQAMSDAIPEFMKFNGTIKEMHQAHTASGTTLRCEVQEDGRTYIECLVVDPVAIKKVEAGVYLAFSIGGSVTKRNAENKKIIEGILLDEISLVNRPANPKAYFSTYVKGEGLETITQEENFGEALEELNKQFSEVKEFINYLKLEKQALATKEIEDFVNEKDTLSKSLEEITLKNGENELALITELAKNVEFAKEIQLLKDKICVLENKPILRDTSNIDQIDKFAEVRKDFTSFNKDGSVNESKTKLKIAMAKQLNLI